ICALKRSVTRGKHPPQPVPAFVHVLISSTEQRFFRRIASQICALETLLHEHTCASFGIDVSTLPGLRGSPDLPSSTSLGVIARFSLLLASIDKVPYSDASPTRMPPSKRVPS